jgi:hypothetical protein
MASGKWVNAKTVFLMPLSSIFLLYHCGQFYLWKNNKVLRADYCTDLPHITEKLNKKN